MGEAAPKIIHDGLSEAPDGAFFDDAQEAQEQLCQWPALTFEFSKRNVFGDQLIPTTPDRRVLSVAKAIEAAAPLATQELESQSVLDILKFMKTRFLKGSKVKILGQSITRAEAYDPKIVCDQIWIKRLAPTNHPIVQAWQTIKQLNDERAEYNVVHTATPEKVLTGSELDRLAFDLMLSLQNKEVRTAYAEFIKSANHQPAAETENLA